MSDGSGDPGYLCDGCNDDKHPAEDCWPCNTDAGRIVLCPDCRDERDADPIMLTERDTRSSAADHRVRDPDAVDDIQLDADDVEAAREKALDFLENMDDDEHYRSGFVDACVMMDRILTDPEYFGLRKRGR